jgi:two-component system sensor histidine kinase YesM
MSKRKSGRSFQFVIALPFTIIAVAGIIFVGAFLYALFYRSTMDIIENDSKAVLEQVNLNLYAHILNMMKISDTLNYRVIGNADLAEVSVARELSLLYNANSDDIVSISLFNISGGLVASAPLSKLKPGADVSRQSWFISAGENITSQRFSTPHVQNLFENTDKYNWVVSLSRLIRLSSGGYTTHGVLLVDMNFSGIERICRRASLGGNGYIYVTDGEGELIFHPKQQLIYGGADAESTLKASQYEDGAYREAFGGAERLITVKTVGYTGWKIVSVSYTGDIWPYSQVMAFAVFALLFGIGLMLLVNQIASRYIAKMIKGLASAVTESESGGIDKGVDIGGPTEVRTLGHAINNLLAQRRSLMDAIVLEHEKKRKSELDALQAQINPHFLYNALDSIIWIIKEGRTDEAAGLVSALSRLFRISISRGRAIIPVSDEMEHARNYLAIQSVRFKNRFNYVFNVSDEAKPCATIKLIVQPIIENAIMHGMEFMDGDGLVSIDAFVESGDLFIRVSDNGMGMTEEFAAKLLRAPVKSASSGGSGIGLYNVQERIRIYFGQTYGLTIDSEPDEGARITIRLPAMRYDPEAEEKLK